MIAVALLVTGGVLHGASVNPDQNLSATKIIGCFLTFLFWALSVVVWGNLFCRLLKIDEGPQPVLALALGTLGASVVALALGYLGLLGYRFQWLMNLLLLTGHFLTYYGYSKGWLALPPGAEARVWRFRRLEFADLVFMVIAAAVVSSLALGALPLGGSDELRYHLVGPRLWSEAGRIYLPPSVPLVMQCSYWENLFLWGDALLTGPLPFGLIEGQLFGQWTHALLGYGGVALALYALLSRVTRDRSWRALAVLMALCVPSMLFSARVAKNDWGASLWLISGLVVLFNATTVTRERAGSRAVLGGVLVGAAIATKFTAAFAALGLLFAWGWWVRGQQNRGMRVRAALGVALGLLPILARNAYETGNPFFPAFNDLFQSPWLGPNWQWHQNLYEIRGVETSLKAWGEKLASFWHEVPIVSALLVLPIFWWRGRRPRPLVVLACGTVLGFLFFAAKMGLGFGDATRLFGPGLLLAAAVATLVVQLLCDELRPALKRFVVPLVVTSMAVFTIWYAQIPWGVWVDLFNDRIPTSTVMIRGFHIGGFAKGMVRTRFDPNTVIFSTGDNQIYYLLQANVAVIPEQPELDRRTAGVFDRLALLNTLRDMGGHYLIDSRHWNSHYWSRFAGIFGKLTFEHPEAIIVATASSDIFDLERLEQEVYLGCVKPHEEPTARAWLGFPEVRPKRTNRFF